MKYKINCYNYTQIKSYRARHLHPVKAFIKGLERCTVRQLFLTNQDKLDSLWSNRGRALSERYDFQNSLYFILAMESLWILFAWWCCGSSSFYIKASVLCFSTDSVKVKKISHTFLLSLPCSKQQVFEMPGNKKHLIFKVNTCGLVAFCESWVR